MSKSHGERTDVQNTVEDEVRTAPDIGSMEDPPQKHDDYVCRVCDERLHSLMELTTHMELHDRGRPFQCPTCGKWFLNRCRYKEHERVHSGERPFPCGRCQRSFTTRHNMKRHQLVHDKEETKHRLRGVGTGVTQDAVLQQDDVDLLIKPGQFLDLEPLSEPEPVKEETQPKREVKSRLKQEQKDKKKKKMKKYKNKRCAVKEETLSHLLLPERKSSLGQMPVQSALHQVQVSNEMEFPQTMLRRAPRIQRIAYDMEIIL